MRLDGRGVCLRKAEKLILSGATRTRIVKAAINRFASQPYEATGLRDIVADAGVDVAYVHRRFGSKEGLFAVCLEATRPTPGDFGRDAEVVAGGLVNMLFQQKQEQGAMGLVIVIRSISSRQAFQLLRDNMPRYLEFLKPFRHATHGVGAELSVRLHASREVIEVPQVSDGGEAGLKKRVRSSLEYLLLGDLHMLS